MPRITKNSCIIDLPRIVASENEESLRSIFLEIFIKSVHLYKRGCRIYISLEPFTSNVFLRERIYRMAFSSGSLLVTCDKHEYNEYLNKFCEYIGFLSKEDLWLRTREFIPCVDTNINIFKEFFEKINVSSRCECPSIIKIYLVEDFLKEINEIINSSKPALIFIKSRDPGTEEIIDVFLKETIYEAYPLSILLRDLRIRCIVNNDVLKDFDKKMLYAEPLLRSKESNIDLIYRVGSETIVSLCTPLNTDEISTMILIFYILFKKQEQVQGCLEVSG